MKQAKNFISFLVLMQIFASVNPVSVYTNPRSGYPSSGMPFRHAFTGMINDTVAVSDTVALTDTIAVNDTIAVSDTITGPGKDKPVETGTGGNNQEVVEKKKEEKKEEEPKPSNWTRGLQTSVSFSQISLSNWSAGGQNSAALSSSFNAFMNFKTPDGRISWENSLDLDYGLINQENRRTVKSNDKVDFSTKFGRRASEDWFYSSLINFRTQMAPGYKTPGDTLKISNFMAPAYLNISIGMDHKFDDYISFYLSPVAGRIIYVLDDDLSASGSFGVEPGENKRYEFGGFIRIHFRATLMENISANSRLEFFSNYLDKPQNLNVNSDTRITMQITRLISANLLLQILYDENARIRVDTTGDGTPDSTIGPRLQVKQVFGLGFSFRM